MNIIPGAWELLILLPIILWQIGLPLALLYLVWRIWRRLQQIEERLRAMAPQVTERKR